MQFRQRFVYMILACILMLIGVALLVNVRAQAPEQAQIAFSSDRDGNLEIYVMDDDGENLRRLTDNPADDEHPDWFDPAFAYSVSPTGKLRGTWEQVKHNCK